MRNYKKEIVEMLQEKEFTFDSFFIVNGVKKILYYKKKGDDIYTYNIEAKNWKDILNLLASLS